jgi:hypothetical protein
VLSVIGFIAMPAHRFFAAVQQQSAGQIPMIGIATGSNAYGK